MLPAAAAAFVSCSKCRSRLSRSARRSARSAPARREHDEIPGRQCVLHAKDFSRETLEFVSVHGSFRRSPRDRQTESRGGRAARRASTVKNRSLERAGSANTRPNSADVCSRWSGENPAGSGSNGAPNRDPLRRETSAAFRAPTRENFAAGAGRHARAKTVGALAVQIAGLKSSFHARVPRAGKSSCENKRMWDATESRELYAARRSAVNTDAAARARVRWRCRVARRLWITAANLLRLHVHSLTRSPTQHLRRAPVAENSAVYSSLWSQCVRSLEADLSEQQFNTWIRPSAARRGRAAAEAARAESVRRRLGARPTASSKSARGGRVTATARRGRQVEVGSRPTARRDAAPAAASNPKCGPAAAARQPAEHRLHVRQLRRRQEQPARARRRVAGRAESRQRLQPAVHLRRRRPRQDPPDARGRQPDRGAATRPRKSRTCIRSGSSATWCAACSTTRSPSSSAATARSTRC